MGLRVWLHLLAACVGLATAALIVFLVFGSASSQNSVNGTAPGQGDAAAGLCGTVDAATVTESRVIDAASTSLPTIYDTQGRAVTPVDSKQRLWFARLHAASGMCLQEIRVYPHELRLSASYPKSVSQSQLDAFSFATLSRAFQGPASLRFQRVRLTTTPKDQSPRLVMTSADAWSNFLRGRSAMSLERKVSALREFKQRVGYSNADLRIAGW